MLRVGARGVVARRAGLFITYFRELAGVGFGGKAEMMMRNRCRLGSTLNMLR